jgi:predicted phage terminase large subunit-like protein
MWTREELNALTAELETREKLKEISRLEADLSAFFRASWLILHPGRKLVWSWHYDLLCEYLTLVKQRKLTRLIINVPPRTGKSTIATICFPCWTWATDPKHGFLCASYSGALSTEHSVARRNLILSAWYRSLWGDRFRLAEDQNLKTQFDNDHRGQMIATSVAATALGKGGDTAIIDDPVSAEQALSDAERKTANDWMDHTLLQRLNDPSTSAIVIIMQRLHELDPTGFMMETQPGAWTKICIPLEAEQKERWVFPVSGRVIERAEGEVLQPERFTPGVVDSHKARRMTYAGQYQQRPAPIEGNLIKRSEVRYYGGRDPVTGEADETLPQTFDLKLISADCAFKDLATSDFVAIGVIGVKGRKRYILNVVNKHLDEPATEWEILRQRSSYSPISTVLVEAKANGSAVVQRLSASVSGVQEIEPEGGKIARMFAACGEWQSGDWYVDRNAAWTEPFVQQITMFPGAAHDDMCDMMSQAAIWLQAGSMQLGYIEYLKQEAGRLAQVTAGPAAGVRCPQCDGRTSIIKVAGQWHCNLCGKQWGLKTNVLQMDRNLLLARRG